MQQPNLIETCGECSSRKSTLASHDAHNHSRRQISTFLCQRQAKQSKCT